MKFKGTKATFTSIQMEVKAFRYSLKKNFFIFIFALKEEFREFIESVKYSLNNFLAKTLLKWHLSVIGKKIDLFLIVRRNDEFHSSLKSDYFLLLYLNSNDLQLYRNNLITLRDFAHDYQLLKQDEKKENPV